MSTFLTEPPAVLPDPPPAPPPEGLGETWDPRGWSWQKRLAALAAVWVLSGVYIVAADQQAVVTRFGAVVEPRVLPGIHYALPWPVDDVTRLKVQQLQRLIVGGDAGDAVLGRFETSPASQFLTGDQNLIQLRAAVQYSVAEPATYLFSAVDVGRMMAAAVEAELARQVGLRGVDAVLTTNKVEIQVLAQRRAQALANSYRLGVQIASISIESAAPPPETRDAFNEVASARADSARIVSEAQGYAGDVVPKARGQAQQMMEAAAGYRLRKINEARGDAERFIQAAGEYGRASEVNGRRLYIETMEQILPNIRKLFVDSRGNLDLTILRKGDLPKAR